VLGAVPDGEDARIGDAAHLVVDHDARADGQARRPGDIRPRTSATAEHQQVDAERCPVVERDPGAPGSRRLTWPAGISAGQTADHRHRRARARREYEHLIWHHSTVREL
jgi:hypothetical protein